MYVCICHAITDSDVQSAVNTGGATSEEAVFSHYGVRPQCGRCVPSLRNMVKPCDGQVGCGKACGERTAERGTE